MRHLLAAMAAASVSVALGSPACPQQIPTYHAAARLVQFTVVVNGPQGPVTSLTKNDFVVTDNGKPQPISVFEVHGAAEASGPAASGQAQPAATPPSPNVAVILLDCVNSAQVTPRPPWNFLLPPSPVGFGCGLGVEGVAKYIEQLGPHDRVTLWGMDRGRAVMLSDFNSDRAQLLAALRRFHPDDVAAKMIYPGDVDRHAVTQAALRAIAQRVAQIPGRIHLVWVTTSPDIDVPGVVQALGNKRIAVYPVDERELVTSGLFSSERVPSLPIPRQGPDWPGFLPRLLRAGGRLDAIAAATGGVTYENRNDLDIGIRQAVADAAESYTLGFYVGGRTLNDQMHALRVGVRVHGLHVRYPLDYWAGREVAAVIPPPDRGGPRMLGGQSLRFRGQLVCVTPTMIEVLQGHGILIGALLPQIGTTPIAGQLSQYRVGDEVKITTQKIAAFRDPGSGRAYVLVLTGLQYLGHPDAARLRAAAASRARLEAGNLLALPQGAAPAPPAPQANALSEAARNAMRQWRASLPDFIAEAAEKDTTTSFKFSAWDDGAGARLQGPTTRTKLQYAVTVGYRRNSGSSLKPPARVFPWSASDWDINAFLRARCGLHVEAGAKVDVSFSEPVDGFRFTGPANGCLGSWHNGYETVYAPVRGQLWIARSDHLPRRLEVEFELPTGFPEYAIQWSVDWAPARAGQGRYVLPSGGAATLEENSVRWQSQVRYSDYRQFTVSSKTNDSGAPRK